MKRLVCLKENKIVFRREKVLAWLIELDWLLHCLSVCLIDWLVDWLVIAWWKNYWLIVCSSWLIIEWLIADCVIEKYWLIDSLMEKYIDWFFVPVDVLFDRLRDGLVVGSWLFACSLAWLIDRLLACLLACCWCCCWLLLVLIYWLTDWFICS
jgi:hypothetical protein